jgi:hypothetical protein
MRTFRHLSLLSTALVLAALVAASPAHAAAYSYTDTFKYSFGWGFYVDCANDGLGEFVNLEGTVNQVYHVTYSEGGTVNIVSRTNTQGLRGTGETTGDKYQGLLIQQYHLNIGQNGLPYVYTSSDRYRFTGQGPGNNFTLELRQHVTINANGDVTATVDDYEVTCG